jgi:hypothetical protein
VYLIQHSKCLRRYIPLMERCTWYNIQNVFKYIYPPHGEVYLIQHLKCLQIYLSPSWWGVLDTTFKMSSNISIPLMTRCTWYNIQNVFKYIYPPHGEVYLIQHSKCFQIYLSSSWRGVLDTTFKMSSNISIPPHGKVYLIQH